MQAPVSQRTLELFNDSLERCRKSGDLAGLFYERFVAEPTIRAYFANTDFERQKRMLTTSLYMVMGAAAGTDEGKRHLEQLAEGHARLGIPADLYASWLTSLVEAAAALDPRFNSEVAQAWRDVLLPGIEVMQHRVAASQPSGTTRPGGTPPSRTTD
jgi:hemoglobin-like flavoprotein